jgi:hypothetical protein
MTIEEKYNNAVQMLRSYYDGRNETLRIASSVLQENGFGEDFWQMTCTILRREGILKDFGPFIPEYADQQKARDIWRDLDRILSFRRARDSGEGIFKPLFVRNKHANKTIDELSELEKNEPQLQKELDSLPRIHIFIVDGKQLVAAYAKHKAETSPSDQGEQIKGGTQQKNVLNFYPDSGNLEYGGEKGNAKNGKKDYALLTLLHGNKNTPFSIEEIREKCNPAVNIGAHKFKGEKDIRDTIGQIRFKLKVSRGAYFPIMKRDVFGETQWVLTDR